MPLDPEVRAARKARFDAWYDRRQPSSRGRAPSPSAPQPTTGSIPAGFATKGRKGQTTHGTPAGFFWHQKQGHSPDEMRECGCVEAGRLYLRERGARRRAARPVVCGTMRGWRAHRAAGLGAEQIAVLGCACWQAYAERYGRKRAPGEKRRKAEP